MLRLADLTETREASVVARLPITVIIPVRNEARNLPRCLESLRAMAEVYVVDSQSLDESVEIARSWGAKVVQFHYRGGWPRKRQWAMDSLPLTQDWVLLLDADEALTPALEDEIRTAIQNPHIDGYHLALRMFFLGRQLRYGGAGFFKLALFRRGKGAFECRLAQQDDSTADMEIHEHVRVDGKTAWLKNPLLHRNLDSFSQYIRKHDEYSNWEARVLLSADADRKALKPSLFGSQAQRRRWLKRKFHRIPGSSILLFFYRYVFLLGFLDGVPGLVYCGMQAIQMFQVKAKIYELRRKQGPPPC